MRVVLFGLTISSSWGNGHATILRGLFKALVGLGHTITFFERDVPYYAQHRDAVEFPGVTLHLYDEWQPNLDVIRQALVEADVAMVTSYCPDGVRATEEVLASRATRKVFYDLDTPITLDSIRRGDPVSYLGPRGLRDFDLVLSYTGGTALTELQTRLGAGRVAPLYGSVDPALHIPVLRGGDDTFDLSYLGTYADDRQQTLDKLFLVPARRLPDKRFLIGGSKYPIDFKWHNNVWYWNHVPPSAHSRFYCSSRITLSVTRRAMAEMGYCPSGRLFEAAACQTPILSDRWEGIDEFFEPQQQILIADDSDGAVAALELTDHQLKQIALSARERVLDCHTARHRALELERLLEDSVEPWANYGMVAQPMEV